MRRRVAIHQAGIPAAERGYAMVAAIGAIAVMATIATTLVTLASSRLDTLDAEANRARLSAAANAGIAMGLSGITRPGMIQDWTLDGEIHELTFDGVPLKVHVEDEHGKVMFSHMDPENIDWLMEAIGMRGEQAEIVRDSYADWTDQDDDPGPNGAESEYYNPRGINPRNGWPQTMDELAEIRGFTPQLIDRLRKYATVDPVDVAFESRYASPLAIQVMTDGVADSPEIIQRRREAAGQRTAIALSGPDLKNRIVSIVAVAQGPGDSTITRRAVITLTGVARKPYIMRYVE